MNSTARGYVWGYSAVIMIYNAQHLKLLESAQRGALSLILKTMKSTPTGGLESKRSILPIDLRLEELQQHEAMKLVIKEDDYIQSNMNTKNKAHKIGSLFENFRSLTKQILQFLSQTKKYNVNQILFPKETQATLELFHLPNLMLTLPEKSFSCRFYWMVSAICNTTSAPSWTQVPTKP